MSLTGTTAEGYSSWHQTYSKGRIQLLVTVELEQAIAGTRVRWNLNEI
jgi:hypothetical protein